MTSRLGRPLLTDDRKQTWVQTDRKAHEAWGRLARDSPRAAALLHTLVAHMDTQAAVVCSYATLAQLTGMSFSTVRRAVDDLRADRWIQVLQIGGKGGGLAFVVNSAVAWATGRDALPGAIFTASVIVSRSEQTTDALDSPPLRRIPALYPGERQLPIGPGEDPPFQPSFEGLDIDPPALSAQHDDT